MGTFIFLIILAIVVVAYKKINIYAENKNIACFVFICIVGYLLFGIYIPNVEYKGSIGSIKTRLKNSEYSEAYAEMRQITVRDSDKELYNQVLFLHELNSKFNNCRKFKPVNYADVNKNKNFINSLISLNTYVKKNENKAVSLDVENKFEIFKSKLLKETENIGISSLDAKLDANKIAIKLNIGYKNWLTSKQKAIKLAEQKREQAKAEAKKQAKLKADQEAKQEYMAENPTNLKDLCSYVITSAKKSYSEFISSAEIFDGYDGSGDNTIMFKVVLNDGLSLDTSARMIATDMIFDAYKKTFANNLNTQSVTVHIFEPDGTTDGLTAGLGRNTANAWENPINSNTASSYGGTNFINLLKKYDIDSSLASNPNEECFADGEYSE